MIFNWFWYQKGKKKERLTAKEINAIELVADNFCVGSGSCYEYKDEKIFVSIRKETDGTFSYVDEITVFIRSTRENFENQDTSISEMFLIIKVENTYWLPVFQMKNKEIKFFNRGAWVNYIVERVQVNNIRAWSKVDDEHLFN